MARLSLKTDFKDGDVLYGDEINTNNKATNLAVSDNYEKILELQSLKADVSDVTTKLSTKVDVVVFNDAINSLNTTKANVSLVNTKADKSELILKADKTELEEGLSKKADVTYVDGQLSKKANLTYVDEQLLTKSDKSTVGDLKDLVDGLDKTSVVAAINSVQREKLPIATTSSVGAVKPDGTTITIDADGTIHSIGGGGTGGTTDYNGLTNRPQINGVTLADNKTSEELGLMSATDIEDKLNLKADKESTYTKDETESAISTGVANKADKSYVDTQLNTKANVVDTYNKDEVDAQLDGISSSFTSALNTKADTVNVYSRTDTDEKIAAATSSKAEQSYVDDQLKLKADKSTTYTKDEVDDLLDNPTITGDTVPIGTIMPFAGQSTPTNWLLCDGREVSRTTYSQLFEAIGTIYGAGDGETSFNLPDYRDRVPVGVSDEINLADTGGEKEHTLTVDEIPNHTHASLVYTDQGYGQQLASSNGTGTSMQGKDYNIEKTGGGQSHNNMQPYIGQNYIIKAKQSAGVVANVVDTLESTSTTDALSANMGKKLNEKTGITVYEQTLESDTKDIVISNLDLEKDKHYKIEFRGAGNATGEIIVKLNDITGYYNHIVLAANGETQTGSDNTLKSVWRYKAESIAYSMVIDNTKTECNFSMDLFKDVLGGGCVKYNIDYSYPHAYKHSISFIRGQLDLDYVASNITSVTITASSGTFRKGAKVSVVKLPEM